MHHRSGITFRAFSLVELVIVIVIIGIIAAIAVPRASRGAIGASESALRGNLAVLRSTIDRYAAEHSGAFPGLHKANGKQTGDGRAKHFYAQLIEYSTVTGKTGLFDPTADPPYVFGPYLREIPSLNVGKNADRKANEVKFDSNSPPQVKQGNKKGWMYNQHTGEIIANTTDADSHGTPFAEY